MATQLTIVNNALRRLREDTVSSVNETSYSQLVAMWVNDGIREVSNSHYWTSLQHRVGFNTAASTPAYDLASLVADGGDITHGRVTTDESMLIFDDDNRPNAHLFASSSATQALQQLVLIPEKTRLKRRQESDTDDTYTNPCEFSLKIANDGMGYTFTFWQQPASAQFVNLYFWTPHPELAIDGTDDSTSVVVHNASVEAYVHMVAANERGEEIGQPGNKLEERYNRILGNAIEAAIDIDGRLNVYELKRD